MEKLKKTGTPLKDLFIIEPLVFGDERGYFFESWNAHDFREIILDVAFCQDNQSKSLKGILRGMHFQFKHPQAKLVRGGYGAVYDVAVDIRPQSPTYGRSFGIVLSEENKKMLFIPAGFAHGFLTLSELAIFLYKVDIPYNAKDEGGIIWNDPDLAINWPLAEWGIGESEIKINERDKNLPRIREINFPKTPVH